MKVAAVHALPFHRWILAGTVAALRARGHKVVEVEHAPTTPTDWLVGGPTGRRALDALRDARPDVVLAADYPYGPLRDAANAPVVGTRHSLAARGNTWEVDQSDADWLASFGAWDRALAADRSVEPRLGWLDSGCPWIDPIVLGGRDEARAEIRRRHGFADDGRPVVAWAPTWNPWVPWREVLGWLSTLDAHVVARPHWASFWRDPERMNALRAAGVAVDDPLDHPSGLLLGADVLVGDISGVVLLALAVPGAALPVVQVAPPARDLAASAQHDPDGPENRFRPGPFVAPDARELDGAFRLVVEDDPWRGSRRVARSLLFGSSVDDLDRYVPTAERLADEIGRLA